MPNTDEFITQVWTRSTYHLLFLEVNELPARSNYTSFKGGGVGTIWENPPLFARVPA